MMGGDAGGIWLGWIWPVILVIGLVTLAWGLLRARSSPAGARSGAGDRSRREPPGEDRARQILRERYARGEISEDEVRELMRILDEP